jgi:Holliday junction resolvase-like predicted endonuclease
MKQLKSVKKKKKKKTILAHEMFASNDYQLLDYTFRMDV